MAGHFPRTRINAIATQDITHVTDQATSSALKACMGIITQTLCYKVLVARLLIQENNGRIEVQLEDLLLACS